MEDTVNTQATKIRIPEYKGHTEIVLTDVNTGEKTVIEEDNIVTNAVRDFFANDALGLINLGDSNISPIRNMFGGVLCFADKITEDVNNYAVPCESVNALVAHAGQDPHSTTSSFRGNPNGAESGLAQDGRGYTFVWDWTTNQGVGTINTVCLTHSAAGNVGTKPIPEFNEHPFRNIQHSTSWNKNPIVGQDARTSAINTPFVYDKTTRIGKSFYFPYTGTTAEIITVEGGVFNYGLNDIPCNFREISSISVTVRPSSSTYFAKNGTSMLYDGVKYLYVFGFSANSTASAASTGSNISYIRIDVDTGDTSSGSWNLGTSVCVGDGNATTNYTTTLSRQVRFYPFNNGYLYLPKSSDTDGVREYVKFDINNVADISTVPSSVVGYQRFWDIAGISPMNINDNFIVGNYYIINSGVMYYPGARFLPTGIPSGASNTKQCALLDSVMLPSDTGVLAGPLLNPYYLATINVLKNPVTKTSSQTMKITYTISEIE